MGVVGGAVLSVAAVLVVRVNDASVEAAGLLGASVTVGRPTAERPVLARSRFVVGRAIGSGVPNGVAFAAGTVVVVGVGAAGREAIDGRFVSCSEAASAARLPSPACVPF